MSHPQSIYIDPAGDWQTVVRSHIESLDFGSVQIVIQDSQVVEIDRTEKVRYAPIRKSQVHENAKVPPLVALPKSSSAVRSRI